MQPEGDALGARHQNRIWPAPPHLVDWRRQVRPHAFRAASLTLCTCRNGSAATPTLHQHRGCTTLLKLSPNLQRPTPMPEGNTKTPDELEAAKMEDVLALIAKKGIFAYDKLQQREDAAVAAAPDAGGIASTRKKV